MKRIYHFNMKKYIVTYFNFKLKKCQQEIFDTKELAEQFIKQIPLSQFANVNLSTYEITN